MKIKSIKFSGDKQYLYFNDKTIIATPEHYDFEEGMELNLHFEGIMMDSNKEIVTIFTLSNEEENFNLFINDGSKYRDNANLLSTFVKIKELPEISPVHFLIKKLEEDSDYRRSWKDNIAMAFKDCYNSNKSLHDNANMSANRFLDILCMR